MNADYGYLNDDGSIQHASSAEAPKAGLKMKVYNSQISDWQSGAPDFYQYHDFNAEVWCVDCNNDRF